MTIREVTEFMKKVTCFEWEDVIAPTYATENVLPDIDNFTFGLEIEFESDIEDASIILSKMKEYDLCSNMQVIEDRNVERKYEGWRLMKETSCDWEIISPILRDDAQSWEMLYKVLSMIKKDFNGKVDEKCGLHIHVGRECFFKEPQYFMLLKDMYSYLEPLTIGIAAGDMAIVSEERLYSYALTIANNDKLWWCRGYEKTEIEKIIRDSLVPDSEIMTYINYFYGTRMTGLNFSTTSTKHSTVEFRSFNGTLNPATIQNYVRYVAYIIYRLIEKEGKLPAYNGQAFYEDGQMYRFDKRYVDECLEFLFEGNLDLKKTIVYNLSNNGFLITKDIARALKGQYTEDEVRKVMLRFFGH